MSSSASVSSTTWIHTRASCLEQRPREARMGLTHRRLGSLFVDCLDSGDVLEDGVVVRVLDLLGTKRARSVRHATCLMDGCDGDGMSRGPSPAAQPLREAQERG
jgi:hypothetical protein